MEPYEAIDWSRRLRQQAMEARLAAQHLRATAQRLRREMDEQRARLRELWRSSTG
jgi:hypothetical protein